MGNAKGETNTDRGRSCSELLTDFIKCSRNCRISPHRTSSAVPSYLLSLCPLSEQRPAGRTPRRIANAETFAVRGEPVIPLAKFRGFAPYAAGGITAQTSRVGEMGEMGEMPLYSPSENLGRPINSSIPQLLCTAVSSSLRLHVMNCAAFLGRV